MSNARRMCSGKGAVTSSVPPRGMRQDQAARQKMQLAVDRVRYRSQRIVAARIVGGGLAIFGIADDWVANRLGMSAQLMGAPGDGFERKPGQPWRDFIDNRVIGHRMTGILVAMLGNPHFFKFFAPHFLTAG